MKRVCCLLSVALGLASLTAGLLLPTGARADELPTLHLRKAATPPPLVTMLQDPAQASPWYSASPTWFGLGGRTGDRNHVEVLATYDDKALYLAFLVIDRSPQFAIVNVDPAQCDRNLIWIQRPDGHRFWFAPQLNGYYPAGPIYHSGDLGAFDPGQNALPGWLHAGWTSGATWQDMVRIPWSDLGTTAPVPGSRWRVNFINDNQTDPGRTAATVNARQWAPGDAAHPDQWGTLAFDSPGYTPPAGVSAEATLTLRPATGFGGEATIAPGDNADRTNLLGDGALTQSNWNDWDATQYELKELLQFDLSLIPRDRTILSATLDNYNRGPYEGNPSDLFVHVLRLAGPYNPATVTMLTSPLPVENGDVQRVHSGSDGSWVRFDVTDAVAKAFAAGAPRVSLALAGSSGDTSNGKIWDTSFAPANWYEAGRPRLHITFGKPGTTFPAPIQVGTFNNVSVATAADKNKLTNGTFRHGQVEGISNTTYWNDPGSSFTDHNIPSAQLAGDINPLTGDPALRFVNKAWAPMTQIATGIVGGQPYTLSAWVKNLTVGGRADIGVSFRDAAGNQVASNYIVYSGSGSWERLAIPTNVPTSAVNAEVSLVNWTDGSTVLFSDVQLEAGGAATGYAETMGYFYPDYPRPAPAANAATVPLRRFHNPYNNEEFYTANADEAGAVSGYMAAEGVAAQVYRHASDAPGLVALHRFYNPYADAHFWSAAPAEIAVVSRYMRDEGVAAYVLPAASDASAKPMYRAYNPSTDRHLFTPSAAEFKGLPAPWIREGVAYYTR